MMSADTSPWLEDESVSIVICDVVAWLRRIVGSSRTLMRPRLYSQMPVKAQDNRGNTIWRWVDEC